MFGPVVSSPELELELELLSSSISTTDFSLLLPFDLLSIVVSL